MLDIKLLRDDPERIAANLRARNVSVFEDLSPSGDGWAAATVERLVALDRRYRELLTEQEHVRAELNDNAQSMKTLGKAKPEEGVSAEAFKAQQQAQRETLITRGRGLRSRDKALLAQAEAAQHERDGAWARVPNLTHPDVPTGHTDDDHAVISTWGKPRDFAAEGFAPKDHLEIAEALDLIDFAAGAKVAGNKFYYLKHEAVRLDLALQLYALGIAQKHGFVLHTTPDLARSSILEGLGFNPRGESTQVYSVAESDLCLVGTAEITLGGMLADTVADPEDLPRLTAGLSHCFRTEAGAAGQESKGLYRVHQFTKVELFAFTEGDLAVSESMHARFLAIEEEIFQGLGLPYRVLDIASGDLGGPAYRKYDIEVWMPGRGTWGEVTSTSNCTDYQARRLKIRHRTVTPEGKKGKNRHCHMLNGTAIANSRAIVALLERYQQADGSVLVPEVLQSVVGTDRIGPR
ncbi:MAG: serine--tRNA ligase [Myxococcota bacterium]